MQGAIGSECQTTSAKLDRQQYVLDSFMANIPDYIYFKDTECRFTQVNPSARSSRWGERPAEIIGKVILISFPPEQAQIKYEQDRRLSIPVNQSLAWKEPDGLGRWTLTTKMPLRDENGAIIGTFGISRNITDLNRPRWRWKRLTLR